MCTRTGFSHDLFIAREECAALCTAAGELEVPFTGGVSVAWLRCGDSACHQGRPDRSAVIPEDTSSEEQHGGKASSLRLLHLLEMV